MIARTKIIATLGPSSSKEAVIRRMYIRGLDCVRLNFSHGSRLEHLNRIKIIRKLNARMHRAVKIMQDLEGYRIRVGKLKDPLELKKGSTLYLTQQDVLGNSREVSFDYLGSLKRIKTGFLIYIDDGKLMLRVSGIEKNRLKTKIISGGQLRDSKGINIPEAVLEFGALTEKDKKDLRVAVNHKLDYLAQSFVRNAGDLKLLKKRILPGHPKCRIFAKIENRQALENIDEIISEADGIIVARGDLGICVPIYKVPVIQKEIIKKCILANKPVVVATQMLDSMTACRIPTRAEVSDVANAILDGATHLMLSGETTIGEYPCQAVDMMNKIIKNTESYQQGLKR
ncbi:MAG: pyruvate kinase [Candidatus Omnitrophica bacterium]|nr:pyruvate kinase [Candidatus Omnitrophota bacterium]MDD5430326.1 pyruvate kinase [Candidatus Omnitrophota bacterium]